MQNITVNVKIALSVKRRSIKTNSTYCVFPMATTNGGKVTFHVGYIPVSGGILLLQYGYHRKGVKEFLYIGRQRTHFFGRTTLMFEGAPE